MSNASKAWRVDLDGAQHDVEAEHHEMTGKVLVRVDGQAVTEERMLWFSKHVEFNVDGHPAELSLSFQSKFGGLILDATSTLRVDGKLVEPMRTDMRSPGALSGWPVTVTFASAASDRQSRPRALASR